MHEPKIAFVGTGGAARGIAHLGVLKACEEFGIKPDIFVGASAGAIVAATYGQGIPLDVLIDGFRSPWRRRHNGPRFHGLTLAGPPRARDFLDPGYLLSGLYSIDGFERYLARHIPTNDFEKVRAQLLITAVDIDRAERVVFGRGYDSRTPISRAVAASCCVPGLFRPYEIDGRYHVDGEIARTLSADIAVAVGADIVIISNIYRPTKKSTRSIARLTAAKVMTQSLNIMLTEKEKRGLDLYSRVHPNTTFIDIAPNIGMFDYLNRFAARALLMRGYRAAFRALGEARRKGVFDKRTSAPPRVAAQ
ncbi:MAG TPA: patatin-like phospholipase family protein [Polyangiaceae bacterium]|jgi:NTE family protein|nr:patatin-like phospholipase family protein [Polyangiaceae bacterium]